MIEHPPTDSLTLVTNQVALEAELARRWRSGGGRIMPAVGVAVLTRWLDGLLSRSAMLAGEDFPALAGRWELEQLWQAAINSEGLELGPAEQGLLASQCLEADRLLRQWVDPDGATCAGAAGGGLPRWRAAVQAELRRRGRLVPADLPQEMARRVEAGRLPAASLPCQLEQVGFVELSRAEAGLFHALAGAGVRVTARRAGAAGTPRVLAYELPEQELAAAAEWARERLAAGAESVAVVVNGIERMGTELGDVFANTLHPGAVLGLGELEQADFHLPHGMPLDAHPLVVDALALLQLAASGADRPQEFPLISHWLRSPAWAGGLRERAARAALEMDLRRTGVYRWSPGAIARRAQRRGAAEGVGELIARVEALAPPSRTLHPARQFCHWLNQWGWGHETPADRLARDAHRRVGALLEEFGRMPFMSPAECLGALRRACAGERLRAAGGALSPVQVLSPEQAVGRRFDAARVLNLSALNWPGPAAHNPLLGAAARRCIPRASDAGMREYAARMTAELLGLADEVTLTWHRRDADAEVEVSPLLAAYPVAPGEGPADGALWRRCAPQAATLSDTEPHPWMQARPRSAVSEVAGQPLATGVVTVLEYQSACPLAGFLLGRLGARVEPPPGPFAPPSFAGSVLHRALERLYTPHVAGGTRPGTSEIAPAVDGALDDCRAARLLAAQILESERERYCQLLAEWLAFEADAWPFCPLELERRNTLDFEGLAVRMRIDRLDALGPDGLFLIDYKTGAAQELGGWARHRPASLQLPLYAVLLQRHRPEQVLGLAIARVRRAKMQLQGVTGRDDLARDGVQVFGKGRYAVSRAFAGWEQCLAHWDSALAGLAREVVAGECVHRMHNKDALRYAGLEPLLRTAQVQRWLDRQAGPAP